MECGMYLLEVVIMLTKTNELPLNQKLVNCMDCSKIWPS